MDLWYLLMELVMLLTAIGGLLASVAQVSTKPSTASPAESGRLAELLELKSLSVNKPCRDRDGL